MREGWVQTTLGEIATTVRPGGTNGVERYVGLEHFDPGYPRLSRWDSTANFTSSSTQFRAGDVLFSKLRPYLRKVAVPHFDGRCTNEALVYRPSTGAVDRRYLALVLQADSTIDYANASSAGSRMPRTSAKFMASLPVTLPPLAEQRRIVDLIGALDDTIAAAESVHEKLKVASTSFAASLHERAHGQNWPEMGLAEVLGDLGAIRTGPFGSQLHQKDYVEDGPVRVVMPANMRDHRVDLSSAARIRVGDAERLTRHITQVGDILWSRRGDVTRFAIIDEASAGSLCGTGCFLLRPSDRSIVAWLEPWLASPQVGRWLESNAVGATMKNLNRTILSVVPVRVPPVEARIGIGATWNSMRLTLGNQSKIIGDLRTLRSNLLTALLSGEHEILESYDGFMDEAV